MLVETAVAASFSGDSLLASMKVSILVVGSISSLLLVASTGTRAWLRPEVSGAPPLYARLARVNDEFSGAVVGRLSLSTEPGLKESMASLMRAEFCLSSPLLIMEFIA